MSKTLRLLSLIAILGAAEAVALEKHVVYPTGDFAEDIENIQSIVFDAATRGVDVNVLLKATNIDGVPTAFNFGEGDILAPPNAGGSRWSVIMAGGGGDTYIVGERTSNAQTTINGGYRAFFFFRDQFFSVKKIRFVGTQFRAIEVWAADSVLLKENEILDMNPRFGFVQPIFLYDLTFSGRLVGNVKVIKNMIQGRIGEAVGGPGIFLGGDGYDAVIKDNSISDLRLDAIYMEARGGNTRIESNILDPGGNDAPVFNRLAGGIGIHIFSCFGPATYKIIDNDIFASDFAFAGIFFNAQPCDEDNIIPVENSLIEDNRIVAGDSNGILVQAPDGIFNSNTIEDNEISVAAQDWGFAAIDLFTTSAKEVVGGRIDNNIIVDNEISGFGVVGVGLADLPFNGPPGGLTGNVIADNDFDDFEAQGSAEFGVAPADIFFNYEAGRPYACGNSVIDQEDDLVLDPEQCNFIESDDDDDD